MSLPVCAAACMALISGAIFMKLGRAPAIKVICIVKIFYLHSIEINSRLVSHYLFLALLAVP